MGCEITTGPDGRDGRGMVSSAACPGAVIPGPRGAGQATLSMRARSVTSPSIWVVTGVASTGIGERVRISRATRPTTTRSLQM